MVPVAFAEPYISVRRGLVFVAITTACVLAMVALARFTHMSDVADPAIRWVETAFIVIAVPLNVLHVMVIVWNNAAALRTSEGQLAEHAADLAASRTRLITAADEERRRLERDLHDGAQQHLVALSVLIQLARNAERDRAEPLLTEASELLDTAISEIRRLAHGIYPPLLISGGLAEALPALAARAPVPVQLNLGRIGRYPPSTEAAFYYCCSEALQNAVKHGGPDTTVTVTAVANEHTLTLMISDTGCGFTPTNMGMGLTNMTDRLSAIGGRLGIYTAPGRGTRITAALDTPVDPAS
jgi:signal transduction histidine kinase